MPIDLTQMVFVQNKSKDDFEGRYNGEDIVIPAGGKAGMSAAAAQHLFGYGIPKEKLQAELLSIAARYGWTHRVVEGELVNHAPESILRKFNDFVITGAKLVAASEDASGKTT